ncbi:MAG: helix-turn-helix transcriptional regulator [Clostridia bacterium]|nr:helix-turn-helix transcriptional regulator [Clostridia bacterium]
MFKEILLDLLKEKGLNQNQLSKQADIPLTTISGWINANRLPDYNALRKLSIFFDVSADYLLGLKDEY